MKPKALCKEKTRRVLHDYLQLTYIFENYGNQKNCPKKAFPLLLVLTCTMEHLLVLLLKNLSWGLSCRATFSNSSEQTKKM